MAMPRPVGKVLKIAEQVVPGLMSRVKRRSSKKKSSSESLSKVEIMQTNNIENKEGLR